MEGYLYKKGGLLSTMQRRYCVLKGTMLAYYTNADECKRQVTPRDVLEVVQVRDWDGAAGALRQHHKHAFEIDHLGGATYQCHCDSQEDKQLWMKAIQHALDEPNRIVQDEIEDTQRRLLRDSEQEDQAMTLAAEAVRSAQRLTQETLGFEQAMKENTAERHALEEKLQHTRVLYEEAKKKSAETRQALDKSRQRAHDAAFSSSAPGEHDEDGEHEHGDDAFASDRRRRSSISPPRRASSAANEVAERVGRLAAQVEVDTTLEETHHRDIEALDQRVTDLSHQYAELFRKSRDAAEESQKLRDAAASSLQQAQSAKQLAKLRIESWTTSSSHLDPLADGYLLCKHPYKPTMHRRYYVLFGNTLCWYKDADTYTALPESPAGVVHVSGVADWNGKIGGMKVLPHAFSVVTVEGKMLCCSAPTRQSVTAWTTALHIGVTMPPLSPHRAVAAKSRRDSFDLVSSMAALSPKKSASGHFQFPKQPAPNSVDETRDEDDKSQPKPSSRQELENQVVVEGYLVKKSAFVPVMKKKYCVLKGLRLFIFDSHDAYQGTLNISSNTSNSGHEEIQVCSISDWDGHGALLHYNYGFQIQTLRHQAIFCSAANNEEKDKWVHGIRTSLLKHRETLLSPTRREDSMIDRARKSLLRKAQEFNQQSGDNAGGSILEPVGQDEGAVAAEEFQALLLEFYTEHNPSKLADVPMLISRYRQRERALVEHLDRIYGTALASDVHVSTLLDKLALITAAAKQQLRRKSSGIKSGLVDFVKMSGYLAWNNDKCYCILSVNKLVRYRTQTHYETEPYDPTEAIVITSVYEYPPPADFIPGPASKNTFFVSYSPDSSSSSTEPSNTSPQSLQQQQSFPLALSSATVEEKLKWMAKIRSGLGFVHANAERASSSTNALVLNHKADVSGSKDVLLAVDKLRLNLVEYYKQQNPRKVGEVDTLLSYFAGRERQLLIDLDATYGTSVAQDPSFLALVSKAHSSGGTAGARGIVSQYESYLWVKHPLLGVTFQRCYCVLSDETWSCYRSSRHAHTDGSGPGAASEGRDDSDEDAQQNAPLLVDVVVNLHVPRNEKPLMDGMTVFSIETLANGPVLLRTDVEKLAQDWTSALRKAVDKYHLDEQQRQERELESEFKDPNGDSGAGAEANRRRSSSMVLVPIDGAARQMYDLLVSFYQLHNPEKVGEVGTLLHAFKGHEHKLLQEIDAIYHSKISADPTFVALLAAIAESQSSKQERDEAAAATVEGETTSGGLREILMEGYLVKRGHLIPSMRKRYCVLLKNASLEYFATHEDSRNPAIRPHGSFQVEIVSDWHGKTASKTYEHGMELETSDGKTFFCATYNADDKAAWMHAFKHAIVITRAEQQAGASNAVGDDDSDELEGTDEGSAGTRADRRVQLRERLVHFYREKNPKKLADLDLLLTCYTRREFALLEAIDNAYGTSLSHDASLLALVPQTSAHSRALATLQYDGSLLRCSDNSWRRSQSVHVAMNGLVLTFYASREGFKGGILAPSDHSVTVLAVKEVDATTGAGAGAGAGEAIRPLYRFSIETTDHMWMYFEAPNAVEKRHWVQILHAALDTILAQSLLEEELQLLQKNTMTQSGSTKRGSGGGGSLLRRDSSFVNTSDDWKGFLLVRLDFMSESEYLKKRDTSVVMEERHFVLHKHNQLVIYNDVQDAIVATFTTLGTRAWDPNSSAAGDATLITTKGDTRCRFPFQILTLEQIVLSCSAATDLLRAKWIKQIRSGAERATALEMLQDQQLQAKRELEHHHQRTITADTTDSADDEDQEIIIGPGTGEQLSEGDDGNEADSHAIARKGYLDYKLSNDTNMPSLSLPLKEGFFVVTQRAEVDVYVDEAAFYRKETPVLSLQTVELFDSPSVSSPPASVSLPPPSPSTSKASSSSAKRHLQKLFGDEAIAASAALSSHLRFCIQTKERDATFVHLFPASISQHDAWVEAFRLGVDLLKGEELLADEKLILHLEEKETKGNDRQDGDGNSSEAGLKRNDQSSLSAPGVAIEGILTPWRLTFSSPRPIAAAPLFYVLVGCRLRSFASKNDIPNGIELSATRSPADSDGGLLDADIVSISDWEVPKANAKSGSKAATVSNNDDIESAGFQVEVVVPPSQSKETFFFSASSFDVKHRWVRVIKSELDFALAETYLDEDAREFARQVAAHMDAIGCGTNSSRMGRHRHEGYVRVRHHIIGSIWRERFAVLDGTRLLLYTDSSAAMSENRERTALEKHDLIAVEKWHPTYSANLGSGSRFGFRVENEAGGYLECTVTTEDEQTKWLTVVTASVSEIATHTSTKVMARDATLPFIPGAAMEGYLKTKEKKKLALFWKSRYCVVIGTQWLLYESQEQAAGGGVGDETVGGVPPLAVYEIAQVGPWVRSEKSSERILEDDDEMASHGFSVQVSVGIRIDCKAQSSLERKRWLNAMEDQLAKSSQESVQVLKAMQRQRDKEGAKFAIKTKYDEVQTDAKRQSARLREALQLAAFDDETSSSGDDDDDDDDEDSDGTKSKIRPRSGSDFIDRSPESSPMRRKTQPNAVSFANTQWEIDNKKEHDLKSASTMYYSIVACFSCCFSHPDGKLGGSGSAAKAGRSITPLGVPGFPANAEVWSRMYKCEYYNDDGYTSDSDW